MNNMFYLNKNIPSVYSSGSRDFQLLCSLYDLTINAAKYDIDDIKNIADTELCRDILLNYLRSKLGYTSNLELDSEALRYILRGFPYVIKNKGTILGIKQAINIYFKILQVNGNSEVIINNNTGDNKFTVNIKLEIDPLNLDESILQDLLQFVIPTGYQVIISYVSIEQLRDAYMISDVSDILSLYRTDNYIYDSIYYNPNPNSFDTLEEYLRPSVGLTQIASSSITSGENITKIYSKNADEGEI